MKMLKTIGIAVATIVVYEMVVSKIKEEMDRVILSDLPKTEYNTNFDNIVLATRNEAEEVLDNLREVITNYKEVSIDDLYGLVGITSTYLDTKKGWTDLKNASISRVRHGYIINFPKTIEMGM